MRLLWITHRDLNQDLTRTSRLGLANALDAQGHEIHWMSPTPDLDYVVHRSKRIGFGHRSFTRSVRLACSSSIKADAVLVEWTAVEGSYKSLHHQDIPWFILDRSPPVSRGIVGLIQRRQHTRAWKIAREHACGAIVKSSHHRHLAEHLPVAVVPAGVDVKCFEVHRDDRETPRCIYIGSLAKERELIRVHVMGIDAIFMGSGNDADRLRRIGADVRPAAEMERIPEILATADIGIMHLPNRMEWRGASPLKVAEYAAAGLCVVTSDVGDMPDPSSNPWLRLVPLGDDTAFIEAVNYFRSLSSEMRRHLGKSAKKWARNERDWSVVSAPLNSLIENQIA
ncbi:MAG: glycosyltransferase [Candidatus Poseidoniales archaeon]|nr:MAG: glycosyltransferase [Candidatus Poseidoniales archaeon]